MKGTVVKFNNERGFGFVRIASWQDDVFVHISDVQDREPPAIGQEVRFDLERTGKGPRAVNVRIKGKKTPRPLMLYLAPTLVVASVLAGLAMWRLGLHALAAWVVAVNAVTFVYFAYDKSAAKVNIFRVPEPVLHALVLVGGTPAALAARDIFRHKTVKTKFRVIFWIILALQAAGVGAWLHLRR